MSATHCIDAEAILRQLPRRRIRPLAACLAMARLMLNTQDTRQVALLEIALAGNSQHNVFRRFAASPVGQAILREQRSLTETLDNHARLRALPENSLGRHYLAFVEAAGLSAQGLMDATPAATERLAQLPTEYRVFSNYTQRGPHDIHHVLLGYGRDELGEICVLAMAYQQLRLPSYKIISSIGRFVVFNQLRRLGAGAGGVFAAVREAAAIGKQSEWLLTLDIEANLATDIDELRNRLQIPAPHLYRATLNRVRQQSTWVEGPLQASTA